MSEIAHMVWDFSLWAAGLGKIPDDGWLIRPSIIWRMCECRSSRAMRPPSTFN
jgi:hypothetical protein